MSNKDISNNSENELDNFDQGAIEKTVSNEMDNSKDLTDDNTSDLESSNFDEQDFDDEIDNEMNDEIDEVDKDDLDFALDKNPEDHPMKYSGSRYLSKYPTRILVGVLLIAGAIIVFALTDVDGKKKTNEMDMNKISIGDNSMFANAINDSAATNGIIPEKTKEILNQARDEKNNETNYEEQSNLNSKPNTVIQPYTSKLELVDPNSANYQYSENTNNTLSKIPSQLKQQKEREILAIRQQKIGLFTSSVNSPSKIVHNFKDIKISANNYTYPNANSNYGNFSLNNSNENFNNSYVSSNSSDANSVYSNETSSKLAYIQNERNRINELLNDGTNNKFQQTLAAMKNSSNNSSIFDNNTSANDNLSLGVISKSSDGTMHTTVVSSNGTNSMGWELSSSMQIPKKYSVMTGSVIPATLITGINSDLPGQIIAQVSQNVFDSPTGRFLLIPQGTRIIGTYDNGIIFGQERVLVSWNRLVFPDGKNIDIGSMNASDQSGYGGVSDQVNNHYLRLFSSSLLLSVISAGITYSQDKYSQNTDNSETTASGAMAQSLGNQMGQTTMQVIQKHMNISPTLEVRPGFRLNVMVTKDILFSKPYLNYDY